MRFALFPFGTRGDVQPMVALGRTLRAQGHDVVIGTATTFEALVTEAGLSFHAVGGDFEGWLRSLGEAVTHHPGHLLRELGAYIERDLPAAFIATRDASAGAHLIVGASLQQAAPSVAEHLGVRFRELLYCPQSLPSTSWPPLNVPQMGLPKFLNRVAWLATSTLMNRMMRRPLNAARARWDLPAVEDALEHCRTATPIVCADPPLLGALPPELAHITTTGALVVDAVPPLSGEVEAFLAAGPPPLYVGFGSMSGGDPEAATRIVLEVARRLEVRVILAGGWGGLSAPEGTPADVLFVHGAPHPRLFPRCRFVVHHGGAGTTTAAARAGVPQLAVPHAADQYYWGVRIEALGVGPQRLDRPKFSIEALSQRIAPALSDDSMRERARALARELAHLDGNARTAALLLRDARADG